MKKSRQLAGTLLMVAMVLGGTGCSSDSPTESGSAPMISQLQVQGAQRISGDAGLVGIGFSYVDPDADIDRFVFGVESGGLATNPLPNADQQSGTVAVQQAVTLPAAGSEVAFTVSVLDSRGNRSNLLDGTFVAP